MPIFPHSLRAQKVVGEKINRLKDGYNVVNVLLEGAMGTQKRDIFLGWDANVMGMCAWEESMVSKYY